MSNARSNRKARVLIRAITLDIEGKKKKSRDTGLFFKSSNDANGSTRNYHILIMHIGSSPLSVTQSLSQPLAFSFLVAVARGDFAKTRKYALDIEIRTGAK